MDITSQKLVRFFVPAILFYLFLVVFCFVTNWCNLEMPGTYEEISKSILGFVLGFVYWLTPLRSFSNKKYHLNVNEKIVENLKRPYVGDNPCIARLDWSEIRHIFYCFVDHDESLKVKSKNIRWNGVFWTSVADARAISVLSMLIFILAAILSLNVRWLEFVETAAILPVIVLGTIFLASFPISKLVTNRHIKLGEEQCEYIVQNKNEELKSKLLDVASNVKK